MFLYQGPVLKLLNGLLVIGGGGGGAVMWNGLENVLKDAINLSPRLTAFTFLKTESLNYITPYMYSECM